MFLVARALLALCQSFVDEPAADQQNATYTCIVLTQKRLHECRYGGKYLSASPCRPAATVEHILGGKAHRRGLIVLSGPCGCTNALSFSEVREKWRTIFSNLRDVADSPVASELVSDLGFGRFNLPEWRFEVNHSSVFHSQRGLLFLGPAALARHAVLKGKSRSAGLCFVFSRSRTFLVNNA